MTPTGTLIVNPRSGQGGGRLALAETVAGLKRGGLRVEVLATERAGQAPELAAQAVARGASTIAVLGGDGTLSEVVSGVLTMGPAPDDLVIAPIPAGTCNSFARDFGLSRATREQSIGRLLSGQTRRIDAARMRYPLAGAEQTRYFVNVFGAGFMAHVADVTSRRLRFLGMRGYSVAVFWQLLALHAPMTRLELWNGSDHVARQESLALVAVCNSQWTGDNMWIAPQADPSDGLLDVLTLGAVSRPELVRLFLRIFDGTHLGHPALTTYRAERITITPARPSPLLADGEVFGSTPVSIDVLPGAVRMAV